MELDYVHLPRGENSICLSARSSAAQLRTGDATVTTLVESLALPACTIDRVQQEQELRFDEDFNGDGEVATPDDMFGG